MKFGTGRSQDGSPRKQETEKSTFGRKSGSKESHVGVSGFAGFQPGLHREQNFENFEILKILKILENFGKFGNFGKFWKICKIL